MALPPTLAAASELPDVGSPFCAFMTTSPGWDSLRDLGTDSKFLRIFQTMARRLSARNYVSARKNNGQMIDSALAAIVQPVRKPAHEAQPAAADLGILQGGRKWIQ